MYERCLRIHSELVFAIANEKTMSSKTKKKSKEDKIKANIGLGLYKAEQNKRKNMRCSDR